MADLASTRIYGDLTVSRDIRARGDIVATLSDTQTLTNKTLDLTDNTLTTTLSQLNSGLSDATLITEAPSDGNVYVRQDGQWVDINNIVYSSSTAT